MFFPMLERGTNDEARTQTAIQGRRTQVMELIHSALLNVIVAQSLYQSRRVLWRMTAWLTTQYLR